VLLVGVRSAATFFSVSGWLVAFGGAATLLRDWLG
jgi:hypothetical protein